MVAVVGNGDLLGQVESAVDLIVGKRHSLRRSRG
jgi:hypothetical protein